MKRLAFLGLALILSLAIFCGPAMAGPTMDRIEKSGKLKLGFREGSIPFAFII